MSSSIPVIVHQLAFLIPSALILAAAIIYFLRTKSLAGLLMMLGSIGRIVVSLFYLVIHLGRTSEGISSLLAQFSMLTQAVALLSAMLFGIGLLMLAMQTPWKGMYEEE